MSAKSLKMCVLGLILTLGLPVSADDTFMDSTAVLVLNQSEDSIPRGNMVYTALVVGLQNQIRETNQPVASLVVDKKDQPNWSHNRTALSTVVDIANNPSLKTVILIDAEKRVLKNEIQISLNYEFYDTEERAVYQSLHVEGVISTEACNLACQSIRLTKEFHELSQALASPVVASLAESDLPAIAQIN